jgi:hypothetical protein
MGRRFVFPLAKLTIITIWPPSLLKAADRPHAILQDEPREKFTLRRSPISPHRPLFYNVRLFSNLLKRGMYVRMTD